MIHRGDEHLAARDERDLAPARRDVELGRLAGHIERHHRTLAAIGSDHDVELRALLGTGRTHEDLAAEAEAVARVRGTSLNALILESLRAEIDKARNDKAFVDRAKELIARDRELLKRLAQ